MPKPDREDREQEVRFARIGAVVRALKRARLERRWREELAQAPG